MANAEFARVGFRVAEELARIGSSIGLKWHEDGATTSLASDTDEASVIDELTAPQLRISRYSDGAGAGDWEDLTITGTAPVGLGRVCSIALTFVIDESSQLTVGSFTADDVVDAFTTASSQLTLVAVAMGDNVELRDAASVQWISRDARLGSFTTEVDGLEVPVNDALSEQYARVEQSLMDCIGASFRDPSSQRNQDLIGREDRAQSTCQSACLVTGVVKVNHPDWGNIDLISAIPQDSDDRSGYLAALDSAGELLWRYRGNDLLGLIPAAGVRDNTGNAFFQYQTRDRLESPNTGVVVIGPIEAGLTDLGSLPREPGNRGRFPVASLIDVDRDSTLEISAQVCDSKCSSRMNYYWNGGDYTRSWGRDAGSYGPWIAVAADGPLAPGAFMHPTREEPSQNVASPEQAEPYPVEAVPWHLYASLDCSGGTGRVVAQALDVVGHTAASSHQDLTGDGYDEVFVTAECEPWTSGWPQKLLVFDGRRSTAVPRLLGVLLSEEDGVDGRGLRNIGIARISGRVVVTESLGYESSDPNAVPSWTVRDRFTWDGSQFVRGERWADLSE
ncbi:hypothetical protein O2V63_11895 [Modestobacter sp. VKM Ac-2977]|uniref:hypothetical protein n=1 Tax=Modestobacter sp. VKM Ac-2977 TaxID=3004131 RepID=UPI0022AB2BD5|nr:hypothetical protein [Modestobacter sp. VKM Ac-2977]MCZ2821034.1 hypothetical protein [Modestobacter sp. VKM Ac-2977]